MATKFERYGNSAFTYLRTGISAGDVVIQLYNIRRFSNLTNTRVRIGGEIVRVTAVDTENKSFTVVRGVEGTVARTHDQGDLVISVLSQGGFDQMLIDRVLYAKQRPQYGQLSDQNGAKAEVADFTWHAQGSSTATDVHNTILFDAKRSIGEQIYSLLLTTPSTPWTFTVGWRPFFSDNTVAPTSNAWSGIVLKNNSDIRLIVFGVRSNSNLGGTVTTMVRRMFHANDDWIVSKEEQWLRRYDDIIWQRVTDNGTDLFYECSRDGVNWVEFFTESRTAWLTSGPDEAGLFTDPLGSSGTFGAGIDNRSVFVHASFT